MNKISIIGLGFVGLPLACILAGLNKKKLEIVGIDEKFINKTLTKEKYLSSFSNNLIDKKLKIQIRKAINNDNFTISNNLKDIKDSNVIVVSINFDFQNAKFEKTFSYLKTFFRDISLNITSKTLIILETTIPPGTSEKVIYPQIEQILRKRKFKKKVLYAYSYERVMPGAKYYDSIVNINRCYSGINNESAKACKNFLKSFINIKKYLLFKLERIKDCETSKILENSYRAVNIAFLDEWTTFANKIGVNLNKVIDGIKARATHNNIMRPGLGVGGYCLTKDPLFAKISSDYLFKIHTDFPLTLKSVKINKKMPLNSLQFLKKNMPRKKLNILILGASYKQDIGDIRSSPSIDLYKYLKRGGNSVTIYDPLILQSQKAKFITNNLPNLNNFEVIIFCVAHKTFNKLKLSKLPKKPHYFDLNMVLNNTNKIFMKQKKFKLKVLGDD